MSATTWVEVSASALERNFRAVADHVKVPVCAVVKANAYGHGLVETARVFERSGARWLAVTRTEEARALRNGGITTHVLILTPPPTHETLTEAIGSDCSITLGSADDIERYVAAATAIGKTAPVHLKVDTGMGRLGIDASEAAAVAQRIADEPHLILEGIFTHFADAAGLSGPRALKRFDAVRAALGKHASRALVHAANSAALLALPGARFDMVRIGTLLYGQNPPGAAAPFELADTFSWFARVVSVRDLPRGATVGYGSEFKSRDGERVATLAVGWADGFTAEPHARTESVVGAATAAAKVLGAATGVRPSARVVYFGDRPARVLGRVGMQAVTVSLADHPEVGVGDVARIPARRLLVAAGIDRIFVS